MLVSEGFADAHKFEPGDRVQAIINGRRKQLKIVGVALSPEYIYQIRPGDIFPDELRFGIFWMNREPLATAFDMDGAFNDVTLLLMPGASEAEVIRRLDLLTEAYGGLGAYGRNDQVSNRFISDEIKQLGNMARIMPVIFLSVAAFLLNMVMARIISTQREQIAALKAFGYSSWAIGLHYLELVLFITLVGAVIGTAAGAFLGHDLTQVYAQVLSISDSHVPAAAARDCPRQRRELRGGRGGSHRRRAACDPLAAGRSDASRASRKLPADLDRTPGLDRVARLNPSG